MNARVSPWKDGLKMVNMFESKRLMIRPYDKKDFEDFLQLQFEDPVMQSFGKDVIRSSTHKVLEKSLCERFSIVEKITDQYCGNIEFHQDVTEEYPEIGITLLVEKQNKGIGTEAVKLFCNGVCSERGIDVILVRIEQENVRSKHLFEKLGAKCVGNRILPIFEKLYREMGKPTPDNSEEIGATTYYLSLPILDAE